MILTLGEKRDERLLALGRLRGATLRGGDGPGGGRRRGDGSGGTGEQAPQLAERDLRAGGEGGLAPRSPHHRASPAAHLDPLGAEVEDEGGVLVDPEDGRTLGEEGFELGEAGLAHVAEAGVMGATLRVVPVGDHRGRDAGRAQQIETLQPVHRLADLVDLVDGDRDDPEGDRRGRREGHAAAPLQLLGEESRDLGPPPLAEGVAGTPRTGEDVVRLVDAAVRGFLLDLGGALGPAQAGQLEGVHDAALEVLLGLRHQLVGVLLEAEGRVDEGGTRALAAHPLDELAVDRRHGRGRLPRAHDAEDAGGRHLTHPKSLRQ